MFTFVLAHDAQFRTAPLGDQLLYSHIMVVRPYVEAQCKVSTGPSSKIDIFRTKCPSNENYLQNKISLELEQGRTN